MTPSTGSRATKIAAAFGGLALALAACGGSDDDAGSAATEAPAAAETDDQTSVDAPATEDDPATDPGSDGASTDVPAALQFTAPLIGGGELDAADFADGPVAFWFWSPF